jgi:hypothetical protein
MDVELRPDKDAAIDRVFWLVIMKKTAWMSALLDVSLGKQQSHAK